MRHRAAALALIFAFQGVLCLPVWATPTSDCHAAGSASGVHPTATAPSLHDAPAMGHEPAREHPQRAPSRPEACELHCIALSHAVGSSAPDASPPATAGFVAAPTEVAWLSGSASGATTSLRPPVPPSVAPRLLHSVFRL